MPRKTLNGTTATIDEVIELHELGTLAVQWAEDPSMFSAGDFERYKELCTKYSIDAATLVYIYQAKAGLGPRISGSLAEDSTAVIQHDPNLANVEG